MADSDIVLDAEGYPSAGKSNAAASRVIIAMERNLLEMEKNLPTIEISQSSFEQGTYRITTSARYVLTEDIKFNPNPSHYNSTTNRLEGPDWMPTQQQIDSGDYPVAPLGPYHMGFFAALTIETDNVVIDLNGFTLEQHIAHYLQQRFFSVIELAPTPFITGQGPSDFGDFQRHKNILIRNGSIGLSSHTAIHGNGPQNVVIKDITCYDYEQAGIGINGGVSIYLKNVQLERNSRDTLVRATYSQGKFIRSFLRRIIVAGDPTINVNGELLTGSTILDALEVEMDSVFNDIINLKREPLSDLFRNPDPMNTCDGSVYGIVLNVLGAAVGPFITTTDYDVNRRVKLENISICGLTSDPVEVPALCVPEDHTKAQRGPVGDVIRVAEITSTRGTYVPNSLSNAQFYWNKHAELIGTRPNASSGIYNDWVSGEKTLEEVMDDEDICFMYGRDAMSHIMKGNIAVFLSGSSTTSLDTVSIRNIENRGAASKGSDYDNYEGNRTRGIAVVAGKLLTLTNTTSSLLSSTTADVYGIDFVQPSDYVTLTNCESVDLQPALFLNAPNHQGHCDPIRGKDLVTNLILNE